MQRLMATNMMVERNDEQVEISIDAYVHYHIDRDFCSDADGNRGSKKLIVYDVAEVFAYDMDGEDFELTVNEIEQAKEQLAQKFIEE